MTYISAKHQWLDTFHKKNFFWKYTKEWQPFRGRNPYQCHYNVKIFELIKNNVFIKRVVTFEELYKAKLIELKQNNIAKRGNVPDLCTCMIIMAAGLGTKSRSSTSKLCSHLFPNGTSKKQHVRYVKLRGTKYSISTLRCLWYPAFNARWDGLQNGMNELSNHSYIIYHTCPASLFISTGFPRES